MTGDYKDLKLIASSNPHIRNNEDTRVIMLDVIIALCPALAWSVYRFGFRALVAAVVSVASAMCWEYLYRKALKKPQMLGDLSAAVTGLLLAMVCPVTLPYWMLIVGNFFAIVLVKQLYGGLGKNFMNPALAGRAALVACYASQMTTWVDPAKGPAPLSLIGADVVTAATPMAMMGESFGDLTAAYDLPKMFMGFIGGSAGEVSSLMLLAGGLYLIFRKVISWHIPVAYIGTVALLALLFPGGNDPILYMCYSVFGGGLLLGAFFMATDYVTSPVTKKGQLIFGVGCGLLTVFIRKFGAFPEGVCYSILLMNCTVWIIDRHIRPVRFGVDPAAEKEKAKEAAKK
jgi:electron transport complex protein RnfD